MRRYSLYCLFALMSVMAAIVLPAYAATNMTSISFKAKDGVVVYGNYYQAPHPKALILLFHQAGSSKAEYTTIAPRLVEAGYSALAIDQRSGGDLFGPNETAAGLRRKADYLEARQDLEAALAWGQQQKLPILIWGSSYSSSLVFLIAAAHPDVKAVLAFSPGEYFDNTSLVRDAASHVSAPIYVTSADTDEEIEAARSILAASPASLKQQYIPRTGGVHGSSTLIEARDPKGASDNWKALLAFLARVPF